MAHRTVRKKLADDCLLDGELHPSIRLRLERVRELPMTAVANLHGVERVGDETFLIWDFLPGRTLEELLPELSDQRREELRREILLVVQRLHSHGIVHGALHARNIIIDERGKVHLTHVSPLLHQDDAKDLAAVDDLLPLRLRERAGGGSETRGLSWGDSRTKSEGLTPAPSPLAQGQGEESLRLRAIAGAIAVAIIGIAIAASIAWYSSAHS